MLCKRKHCLFSRFKKILHLEKKDSFSRATSKVATHYLTKPFTFDFQIHGLKIENHLLELSGLSLVVLLPFARAAKQPKNIAPKTRKYPFFKFALYLSFCTCMRLLLWFIWLPLRWHGFGPG